MQIFCANIYLTK